MLKKRKKKPSKRLDRYSFDKEIRLKKYKLASREDRFWASLIDSIYLVLPLMVIENVKSIFGDSEDAFRQVTLISCWTVYILILGYTAYLLTTKGQTIGKILRKIKIVKINTEKNGGFITNVLLRIIVVGLIQLIPYWKIFGLIDVLWIFKREKRCIHDYIAGTVVVKA